MKRTRDQRRFNTLKYQRKQLSIHAKYKYFIDIRVLGHYRKHSIFDCGNSDCQYCRNPRRIKWNSMEDRLTVQEKRNLINFQEQMDEYNASLRGIQLQ